METITLVEVAPGWLAPNTPEDFDRLARVPTFGKPDCHTEPRVEDVPWPGPVPREGVYGGIYDRRYLPDIRQYAKGEGYLVVVAPGAADAARESRASLRKSASAFVAAEIDFRRARKRASAAKAALGKALEAYPRTACPGLPVLVDGQVVESCQCQCGECLDLPLVVDGYVIDWTGKHRGDIVAQPVTTL